VEQLPEAGNAEEKIWAAYNEAIAWKVREGAPLATYSIDRRALRNYASAFEGAGVNEMICFSCARRFAHVATRSHNEIKWVTALSRCGVVRRGAQLEVRFCGLTAQQTETIFGMDTYMKRYGAQGAGQPDLQLAATDFEDWVLELPFEDKPLKILCCPEDRICQKPGCTQHTECCDQCELPCCRECAAYLDAQEPSLPPMSLTNDMMIFYAPRELYTMEVTVMEMICASVCLTSMICFTLEWKYRHENPFDEKVHMAQHRMGARGNATSFPLPWESMLLDLQRTEGTGPAPDVPWVGEELAERVSLLLKTRDESNPKACAHHVRQAMVRRRVVVQLIEGAVARGHRAYASVAMEHVREKALRLPEEGAPPEVIHLLPRDTDLDKVQVQKAATPVPGRMDVATAGSKLGQGCPNAVVLEKVERTTVTLMCNALPRCDC
jgi:hypothetical protein